LDELLRRGETKYQVDGGDDMSGHHPFHDLAAKVTCTSEAHAAVDEIREGMESVLRPSGPPTALDGTGAEAPWRPLRPHPAEE
jgi:hypothetical protein